MPSLLIGATVLLWVAAGLTAAAPGMVGGDAPELTAAAFHLGPAHAPGYPLYVALGHLFQLLPLGTPAFRLTFLSILAQSAAFGVVVLTLQKFRAGKGSAPGGCSIPLLAASLAMAGPLVFHQMNAPEVFALHFLFISVLLGLSLFPGPKTFLAAGFTAGLALSNQHLTLLVLPALAWAFRGSLRKPRFAALGAALLLLGLSVYLLLPLRAIQAPAVDWGSPTGFRHFLHHLSRGQYGGDLRGGGWLDGLKDLRHYLRRLFLESFGAGILFALLGAWKERPRLAGSYYAGLAALLLAVPFLLRDPVDPEHDLVNKAFLAPGILWLAPLLALGIGWTHRALGKAGRPFLAALLALTAGIFFLSYRTMDASRNLAVEDIGRDILLQLPGRSVLYCEGDAVTFPLAYLKLVLGSRPDAAVFDRTGDLFPDLYRMLDAPTSIAVPPERLVSIERRYESEHPPSGVFYTESTTVPGRPLTMTGLLFQASGAGPSSPGNALAWAAAREPRFPPNADYLSRETGARFYIFRAQYDLDILKDPSKALDDLRRMKETAPDNNRLLLNAGLFENTHGWTDQADLTYERVCELTPDFALAWFDRGIVAEEQHREKEAVLYYRNSIRLDPGMAAAHDRLGGILFQARRYEEAVREWETSRGVDPRSGTPYRALGLAYQRKDPAYSASMLRRYLELVPDAPDKASIEKLLRSQKYD